MRLVILQDSLFADELSTYWIVSEHSLGGVISTVHTDAEITPPLYFVLAWLTTRLDLTAELLRAPSFLAGVGAIPLVYLLGLRTVGRAAAVVASAITALGPFMIYYSTDARGYELMVVLVILSTLALLAGVDDGRARWWVAYAACACAAVYTHYTAVFALGAQFLWLLWAHPEARRAALLASLGATAGFLPWISGLIADLNSPTTKILGELQSFTLDGLRVSLEHWSVGYPFPAVKLRSLPGDLGLVLIAIGVATAIAGLLLNRDRPLVERPPHPTSGAPGRLRSSLAEVDRRLALIAALALAAPVGIAAVSAFSTDTLAARNLAVSWPAFALALATLLVSARQPLRMASVGLVLAGFGLAAGKTLEAKHRRADYDAAAAFIDRRASAGDVVIDAAIFSPGPLTGLEVALEEPRQVFRVGAPQESDHPFGLGDRVALPAEVTDRAVAAAGGGRLFIVTQSGGAPTYQQLANAVLSELPGTYGEAEAQTYQGVGTLTVRVYERAPRPEGNAG
ncbi:MAG: glycosyltransferase family 39 protein [Actinomycetota bacterium]